MSVATSNLPSHLLLCCCPELAYLTLDLRHISHAALMFLLGRGSCCRCIPGGPSLGPSPSPSPSGEAATCVGLGRIGRGGAGIAVAAWVGVVSRRGSQRLVNGRGVDWHSDRQSRHLDDRY